MTRRYLIAALVALLLLNALHGAGVEDPDGLELGAQQTAEAQRLEAEQQAKREAYAELVRARSQR